MRLILDGEKNLMLKHYKYFSPFPFENDYKLTSDENICIAFKSAKQFYLNNNPNDLTPLMFLHPTTSRVNNFENFEQLLELEWENFNAFLLNAKSGLLAGEADSVLRFVDKKISTKNIADQSTIITLLYLKNTALFILGKYTKYQLEKLTDNPVVNCQYILSLIKLEYLINFKEISIFENLVFLFNIELSKIKCNSVTLLLKSHLLKYNIDFCLKNSINIDVENEVNIIIEELENLRPKNNYYIFLKIESKRRIQEYLFNFYFNNQSFKESYEMAQFINSYDSLCPRSHFLLGKVLNKLSNYESSIDHFFISLAINPQDKDQIKKIIPNTSCNIFFVNKIQSYEKTILRFKSFFDPNHININSTISFGPWTQWNSIKQAHDPFFQTMTSQRAMPVRFRRELYYSLNFINPEGCEINQTINYSTFLKNSTLDVSTFLLNKNVDPITRSLQSRLLASLGFYQEALDNLKNTVEVFKANPNAENSYLLSTLFFIEQIFHPNQLLETYHKFSQLFEIIPPIEKTLRIRLTIQMSLCVISGQHGRLDLLENNYTNLMNLYNDLLSSKSFSEFEKSLLSSRVYRASSYLPYLNKDPEWLLSEIEKCQQFAIQLLPTNQFEEILKLENNFPMYESSARTYSFLNDHKNALRFMTKIVDEVDSNDPKAWLQVGEAYDKTGDISQALECYKKASVLSCPLGKISFYKLGRTYEKLNLKREALFSYLTSLHHWPIGPSPLKQILAIATSLNLEQICTMAEENLKAIENDYL